MQYVQPILVRLASKSGCSSIAPWPSCRDARLLRDEQLSSSSYQWQPVWWERPRQGSAQSVPPVQEVSASPDQAIGVPQSRPSQSKPGIISSSLLLAVGNWKSLAKHLERPHLWPTWVSIGSGNQLGFLLDSLARPPCCLCLVLFSTDQPPPIYLTTLSWEIFHTSILLVTWHIVCGDG